MGWIWPLADYRTFGLELKKELKTAGLDIGRSPADEKKQYKISVS
jgi:hypothetical protein